MEAGADDYLVKPFHARELLARISSLLQINRLRREAEQAIRQGEERFRVLFETMSEGFAIDEIIFDEAGKGCDLRYLEVNPAFERHTGLKRSDILGRRTLELFPDAEPLWFERYGEVVSSGVPAHFQAKFGPLERWFEVSAYRTGPKQFAVVFFDITDRKQAEDALKDASRRKDEFLATLAHELRNPLAPIRNSLQILKMPRLDAVTLERTREMMERQVHQLVRLVDDLLDVSRVMRGKVDLRRERIELATVVARAVETAQPLMEAQGHDFTVALPSEPMPLDVDPIRLVQVVGNLLTNAAKYTEPNGRIWLTAQREDENAVLRVRDTGIGIAPDMLPHIFELFVQADHAATRSQGGLGIGLTLVKNLVEMHHGAVSAFSDGLGRGSEFVVRLPLASRAPGDANENKNGDSQPEPARPAGHRLLVVDDNRDAAESLAILLRMQGHEVRVANDGVSALEIIKAYRPALVLLDLGMPKMDGYEVARRLRRQPGLENVRLAALTGWGQQEDRRRSAEAGFDHHFVKPVEPAVIQELVAKLKKPKE
jgi:PAS domain S-box-containing protein